MATYYLRVPNRPKWLGYVVSFGESLSLSTFENFSGNRIRFTRKYQILHYPCSKVKKYRSKARTKSPDKKTKQTNTLDDTNLPQIWEWDQHASTFISYDWNLIRISYHKCVQEHSLPYKYSKHQLKITESIISGFLFVELFKFISRNSGPSFCIRKKPTNHFN